MEGASLEFGIVVVVQVIQDLPGMVYVCLELRRIKKYCLYILQCNYKIIQDVFYKTLEGGWSITEIKWHHKMLSVAGCSAESAFPTCSPARFGANHMPLSAPVL